MDNKTTDFHILYVPEAIHWAGMRVFSFLTDCHFLSPRTIFIIDQNAPNGSFCFKIVLGVPPCKMISFFSSQSTLMPDWDKAFKFGVVVALNS